MTDDQRTARDRLAAFIEGRRNDDDGVEFHCNDGEWHVEVALEDDNTTIVVIGHAYSGGADAIEESCADVIDRLADAGLQVA